jgi:hypothetical protein
MCGYATPRRPKEQFRAWVGRPLWPFSARWTIGPIFQKAAAVWVVIEMLAFTKASSTSMPEVSDFALSLGVLKQQWTARRFYVRR